MAQSESPVIVPQQTKLPLIKAEITVLKAHLEDWRSVKGKQQSHILNAIHKEACLQAPTRDKAILKTRKKNKAHIQEETGETPGSEGMIVKWPEATKTVLAGLSAEEKEEVKVIAKKWNNEAAPPDIQANIAETKGADMMEHFAIEMFKQAGMRVFVMSAWRNSGGKLMLEAHDFNEQFSGGESFLKMRDWEEIFMPEWQHYAGEQFDVEDQDVPQFVTSKKRVPQKLLELEEDDDGWPMLPDTMGWKHGDQQHIIQSFLTRHYKMCMGTDKVKAAVPWGDLVKNQSGFFDSTYWPAAIQLVEPSKMDKADATALLDFWYRRQQKNLRPTFCFKAWKDTDGDMETPAKSFLKAMQRAAQHGKGGEVEEEHWSSTNNNDEEAPMSANDREEAVPPKATETRCLSISWDGNDGVAVSHTLTPHTIHSTNTSEVMQPVKSNMTGNMVAPPKTPHEPAKSAGAQTRSKGLCSNVGNDLPTKASKRRATAPISDTPAKRTRSKAAVTEAPKAKRSRK
ncbi:hypothetical protein EDB19DRAFT_1834603 [Suillus lakei]|nr:hypothetical protein EDB19DRAFT_1834603 [Suillus lakei]